MVENLPSIFKRSTLLRNVAMFFAIKFRLDEISIVVMVEERSFVVFVGLFP